MSLLLSIEYTERSETALFPSEVTAVTCKISEDSHPKEVPSTEILGCVWGDAERYIGYSFSPFRKGISTREQDKIKDMDVKIMFYDMAIYNIAKEYSFPRKLWEINLYEDDDAPTTFWETYFYEIYYIIIL